MTNGAKDPADDPGAIDAKLAFTVATVWREQRISCPHPHLLQSFLQGGLTGGAAEFLAFHLQDSKCPYCNAVVDDLRAREDQARHPKLEDLRDRLLRSTVAALRQTRA
jgi:hypothetical protein